LNGRTATLIWSDTRQLAAGMLAFAAKPLGTYFATKLMPRSSRGPPPAAALRFSSVGLSESRKHSRRSEFQIFRFSEFEVYE